MVKSIRATSQVSPKQKGVHTKLSPAEGWGHTKFMR